jgi:hypothetical protein
LSVHPTQGRAKAFGPIQGLLRWGSENIFRLDLSSEQNAQVFVRINKLDQGPAGLLNQA